MSFRTAAFPRTPKHNDAKQILPWSLAVEMQQSGEVMELAKAYTRLGLQPWTSWESGDIRTRIKRGVASHFAFYQTVVSSGADEQKETEAEGAQGGVQPAKRKR